jgi:hypothetical protein
VNALTALADRLTAAPADVLANARVGDLQLAFLQRGERRKLRIGREAQPPTVEQVQAVLAAFHVPPEPAITPGRMKSQAPKSGRWYTLHYYDITWHEVNLTRRTE